MKTAIIFFRPDTYRFDGEYYQSIINTFSASGITIDDIAVISPCDQGEFIRRLDDVKNAFDNLVIIDGERCDFDFKQVVAERMECVLMENENAKTFVDAICRAEGIVYQEKYAFLPSEATLIPNVNGIYQGFVMDSDEFTLSILPEKYSNFKVMCEKYLLPYLKNKFHIEERALTLKYFGSVEKAEEVIKEAAASCDGIKYHISHKFGDVTISLSFGSSVSTEEQADFTRTVLGQLKEDVYAEYDVSLGERLFDLIKLRKLKMSVAESFTGGTVSSTIILNPGGSEFLTEGIVAYSNESKVTRLGVEESAIKTHGAVSSTVAYQMAAGLLKRGMCDVAIATTGIAGPGSDGTDKPVGLGFIAVGMKDGVHTYRYQFSGNREEIMETAKNTALFLAIKKLKNV